MRKGYLLATVLICSAQTGALRAEDVADAGVRVQAVHVVEPEQAALARRLAKVLAEARDEAVRAPAEQAQLALARAREARDAGAKARQLGIAHAALALAEARAALLRERDLLRSTTRRRLESARRAEQARALLKQAERPCPSCTEPPAPASGQP